MVVKNNFDNYIINGIVVHGNGRGKTVGMPTANLDIDIKKNNIEEGVYASIVTFMNKKYIGVTNIGTRPSVDNDSKITIETNIIDFNQDIYGKEISIQIVKKLRNIVRFDSLLKVKEQVDKDKLIAYKICKNKL